MTPVPPWYDVEPWAIAWSGFDESRLAHAESLFTVSNGNVGWRGTLDQGAPVGAPGVYLNGVFERRPLPHAEQGYGFPRSGESVVAVHDATLLRVEVDGDPVDVRTGELRSHRVRLDFRSGMLRRDIEWVSPRGRAVRVSSQRLVSFAERAVGAVRLEVEALDPEAPVEVVVRSELDAERQPVSVHEDPRIGEAVAHPFEPVAHGVAADADDVAGRASLAHRTRSSRVAAVSAMAHRVGGGIRVVTEASPRLARATVRARLAPGERVRVDKLVAAARSEPGGAPPAAEADAALDRALALGWEGLAAAQRAWLDDYWRAADVELDGDPRLQQAVRFAVFQVAQATARADGCPIASKGLTGRGYEGHAFWESEIFIAPVLDHLLPAAAADALRWRHAILPAARRRAVELGVRGAAFPWRTIDGDESSGYWPAGTAAVHIGADIAHAVLRHVRVTGDRGFEREVGVELLVETARLWAGLGRWGGDGLFHLDGVTGPDEYSAIADDNVYTNLAARQNLRGAAAAVEAHPDRARELGVDADEVREWRRAADAVCIPFDTRLGVHAQARGFTERARWDFEAAGARYPLDRHHPYLQLYRHQVVKQPDLVLALHLHPDAFAPEQAVRDFAYYEPLTVRDSSLSSSTCGVVAARLGHLELARDYLLEGALLDPDDLHGSTGGGLHVGCLAGVWSTVAEGFGGLRCDDAGLSFAPRLPPDLARLSFGVRVDADAAAVLRVEVREGEARYELRGGGAARIRHHGEEVELAAGEPRTLAIPPPSGRVRAPRQPKGRSPREVVAHPPPVRAE